MKKFLLLLFLFVNMRCVCAQDANSFSVTFDHVALSVKDVDHSAEFYRDVLQLQEITNRSEMAGIRWFAIGEGKELHLISIVKEDVTINKAIHFALTTPNFNQFIKALELRNIAYSDWPGLPNKITIRADGIRQIFFQDPDGYWIEVNSASQE